MKRRWTILFFIALSPLIGLSWLAAKAGFSTLDLFSIHAVGLLIAAAVAGLAMLRSTAAKWPAGVALFVSLPMGVTSLLSIGHAFDLTDLFGLSLPLVIFGSLATTIAATVILIRPLAQPPQDPPVAPARVVD